MEDQERFTQLPECIRRGFEQLNEGLSQANARWILYQQLFAHSEARSSLLMDSAPGFFEFLFHVLRDDIFMAICRLGDPPEAARENENLGLQWIMAQLDEEAEDAKLLTELRAKLESYLLQSKPFRDHRNKRLAHSDVSASLVNAVKPLPGVTISMIRDVLATAADYLNAIELHYCNSRTGYEYFGMLGDADTLAYCLAEAIRYKELQRSGAVAWDDLDKGKWHEALHA